MPITAPEAGRMTDGPYSTTALTYWQAGWRGILPLPARKKANPPTGYTGERGADPSYADIFTWTESPEGTGNIALRMPRDVIGVDVDNYGGKHGGATLTTCEAEWGALPPTWRSTSRDDGISGIRLYRVPEGLAWPGEIQPDIEILQHRHRYAVVCPSIHPEGRTYRWLNPAGVVSTTVPDPDELPQLPAAWIEGLTGGELATATARNTLGNRESAAWIVTLPQAMETPCTRMRKAIDQMPRALLGSAHAAARDGALRAVRLGSEGHAGVVTALADIQRGFTAEATSPNRDVLRKRRRSDSEARKEWDDLVSSAVNLVTANPSPAPTCDCRGQITGLLVTSAATIDGANALAPVVQPLPAPAPSVQERNPQEATARLKDGATFILDAPEGVPTVWGDGDEVLWAEGEALMLVGPPGVGKTTLCGQIVRARLGLAGDVLGLTVNPTGRRILYLAMDRPAQIARSLRRTFTEADRDVLADRLRVWEGPPPGDVARNVDIFVALAQLADADTIVVDSVKDAAIGLTEDEVAAGYNRARQTALAAGVQVLELHHLVKRGANGAKPTTLADVYGSAWLTAGAGSVALLWGAAGDPIVEFTHLKQPVGEVGPWRVLHDHTAGESTVFHATDLLTLVAVSGRDGITAKAAAQAMFEEDDPSRAQIEKARAKLRVLVDGGHLSSVKGANSTQADRYVGLASLREASGSLSPQVIHNPQESLREPQENNKTAGQSLTPSLRTLRTPPTPPTSGMHPPLKGGVLQGEATNDQENSRACRNCGDADATYRHGVCDSCGGA